MVATVVVGSIRAIPIATQVAPPYSAGGSVVYNTKLELKINLSIVLTFAECSHRGPFVDSLTDSEAGGIKGTLTIESTGRRNVVETTTATLNFSGFELVRKGKASGIGGNSVVTVFVDTEPGAGENWQQVIQPVRCNKLGL